MYEAKAWATLTVLCPLTVLQVKVAVYVGVGNMYETKACTSRCLRSKWLFMLQVGNMYAAKAWAILTALCPLTVLQVKMAAYVPGGQLP